MVQKADGEEYLKVRGDEFFVVGMSVRMIVDDELVEGIIESIEEEDDRKLAVVAVDGGHMAIYLDEHWVEKPTIH